MLKGCFVLSLRLANKLFANSFHNSQHMEWCDRIQYINGAVLLLYHQNTIVNYIHSFTLVTWLLCIEKKSTFFIIPSCGNLCCKMTYHNRVQILVTYHDCDNIHFLWHCATLGCCKSQHSSSNVCPFGARIVAPFNAALGKIPKFHEPPGRFLTYTTFIFVLFCLALICFLLPLLLGSFRIVHPWNHRLDRYTAQVRRNL